VIFERSAMSWRPELALQVALVISNWSYVENSIGRLLSFMMGVKAEVGIAMYTSLMGGSSQDAVLEAVAQNYYSQERLDVFHAVKKCTDGPKRQRNYIAHGLWGYSAEMPDCLLWLPAKEALKNTAEFHGVVAQQIVAKARGEEGLPTPLGGVHLGHVMVYREADFNSLCSEISKVNDYWDLLLTCQIGRAVLPEITRRYDELFEKLCNEPPIHAALEKIRKGRQNGP
jgi:hypothetical protein